MIDIQSDVSLLPYNTFQVDVQAKYFVDIHQEEDLEELFETGIFAKEKHLILGGGANVLFTQDINGLVIKVSLKGIECLSGLDVSSLKSPLPPFQKGGSKVLVQAMAGEDWSGFVEYCNRKGRAGIENLIAIPGQVGTAPVSNIGAYGMEIGERVVWVEGYDLEKKEWKKFDHEECGFAYRDSIFKSELRGKFLITRVVFALEQLSEEYLFKLDYPDVQRVLEERSINILDCRASLAMTPNSLEQVSEIISEIRASKLPDPNKIGTAGSFFANPIIKKSDFDLLIQKFPELISYPHGDEVKLSAGQLIDLAGLKGYSNGKAGTSSKHALIVINEGGSAEDVLEVVEHIQIVVKEKFGVALKPEVVYI
ncbi:MAG: UDP-N-acetylmuramate dehydrogenase [Candidatus Absconditabacteria bacterium]|nr:UDP-N-acetylmuramate dehydrogenase [Candidatus Absconditabacteria bacterium]MDD4714180.1 UDP-N-acetylmuramate dehydrogenase [Candidatus Absconditabacteria bacterium]